MLEDKNRCARQDAILQGDVDFESKPWPKTSNSAQDLIIKMLNQDPRKRITSAQVLDRTRGLEKTGMLLSSDKPIDSAVLSRMKEFRAINKWEFKLKKKRAF